MRTHLHLLTAACLMTSSLFLFIRQRDRAVDATVTKTTVHAAPTWTTISILPPGIAAKDLNSDKAIEKSFKGVTEYALDTTGFDNIVSYLAPQDNERIKKSTDKSLNNLDGDKNKALTDVITNLDANWQTKYGKKFSIDAKLVYTPEYLHIMTGEVSDPSLLIGQMAGRRQQSHGPRRQGQSG